MSPPPPPARPAHSQWLAIDTVTDIASVAFGSAERYAALHSARDARQHAAQLVPMIKQILGDFPIARLAGIVVGDGPGSFTGLRIGWAAAKGLAHEHALPLVAVPALLGFAHAAAAGESGPVVAAFDALRGQVFGAIYAFSRGAVETIVAPELFTIGALARVTPVRPRFAVGDGAERYGTEIESWIGRSPVALDSLPPVAGSLLTLSSFEGARRRLDDPALAEPIYGRPAEAQAKWEARYGRPLPHSSR
jgi:tRNA threonylcarbamoyladenosine biosynthesis protein TsaB